MLCHINTVKMSLISYCCCILHFKFFFFLSIKPSGMFYASEKPMSFQRQNSLREVPPLTKLPVVDKLQGLHAIIHQDTSLGPIRLRGTRNASYVTALTANNVIRNGDSLHSLLIVIYENSDERTVSYISCLQHITKSEAHECCMINRLAAITVKSPPHLGLTFKKVPEMSYRNLNRVIQKIWDE